MSLITLVCKFPKTSMDDNGTYNSHSCCFMEIYIPLLNRTNHVELAPLSIRVLNFSNRTIIQGDKPKNVN